mgnify:CR=1 FL=1
MSTTTITIATSMTITIAASMTIPIATSMTIPIAASMTIPIAAPSTIPIATSMAIPIATRSTARRLRLLGDISKLDGHARRRYVDLSLSRGVSVAHVVLMLRGAKMSLLADYEFQHCFGRCTEDCGRCSRACLPPAVHSLYDSLLRKPKDTVRKRKAVRDALTSIRQRYITLYGDDWAGHFYQGLSKADSIKSITCHVRRLNSRRPKPVRRPASECDDDLTTPEESPGLGVVESLGVAPDPVLGATACNDEMLRTEQVLLAEEQSTDMGHSALPTTSADRLLVEPAPAERD